MARLRSYGVGEPPRWIYPSTVSRVSNPVSYSISSAMYSAAFFAVDGLDTFCHNDDGVGFSFFQSFDNGVADVVDIIG